MVSFEKKVSSFIEEHNLVLEGDRLLIACSGGIDSMALLHYFISLRENLKINITVAHVDHMLRGKTSYEDRVFVEDFCNKNGISIFSTSIPIPKILEEQGGNSQAVCRRERYAFFADVMEKNSIHKLVTAHHADDQLESMLMSLVRAGSLNGLKGIYATRTFSFGTIIRPFLSITKNEIGEYLKSNLGTYREDSSNAKDDYTRNRFRHHIIPLLKKENVNVSLNAAKLAEQIQEDDDFLYSLATSKFSQLVKHIGEKVYELNISTFNNEPISLQRRIILILLNYLYDDSKYSNSEVLVNSILEMCKTQNGSATLNLPNQLVANRRYAEILFEKKMEDSIHYAEKVLHFNEWIKLQNGICLYIEDDSNVTKSTSSSNSMEFYLNSNTFEQPFRIRPRKVGDRINLRGMVETKRLSRLFIDEKVPLQDRDNWPILVDNNDTVMMVIGIRENKNISKIQRAQDDIKIIIEYNNIEGI